jgi:two-component system, OmpR family, sensor kinase
LGRLLWKFLLAVLLAQIAAMVATTLFFSLTDPHFRAPDTLDAGPGARAEIRAAAAILEFSGEPAFRSWASQGPQPAIYAIDDGGRDLLGRSPASALVDEARALHKVEPASPLVTEVFDPSQHHWLLFANGRDSPIAAPQRASGGTASEFDGPPRPPGPPYPRGRHWPPFGVLLTTLCASVLTALLLAWYVAKPVRSLRLAVAAAAGGRLDYRVAPSIGAREDELADLGREFDRMTERLQSSMSQQKRLLHDVSHEVRSPLARLQAAVGILRQRGSVDEVTVSRIEEEIARIDQLVGNLLALSRIEAGELTEEVEEVDLREIIAQVVSDANFEAQPTGHQVIWKTPEEGSMRGRPALLHVAFENVVRNALKYAAAGKIVEVETKLDAGRENYIFRVLDSGPGIAEADLPKIFTPFFRSSPAASDGYGLGLAIAQRSIEAHRGSIRAENRPACGLCIEIVLPLASTSGAN